MIKRILSTLFLPLSIPEDKPSLLLTQQTLPTCGVIKGTWIWGIQVATIFGNSSYAMFLTITKPNGELIQSRLKRLKLALICTIAGWGTREEQCRISPSIMRYRK